MDTCFGLLKFGGAGHTAASTPRTMRASANMPMRMPAMRVLVNTPAPQGSTGITTNVFPSMTLGCGAMAGNSTSDNVGPQHLINIKRLAYTVRTPEAGFEMPLDYDKAPDAAPVTGGGRRGRSRGRRLRGGAVPGFARHRRVRRPRLRAAASCGCSTPAPQPGPRNPWWRSVAAEVVDRFLARRGSVTGRCRRAAAQNPAAIADCQRLAQKRLQPPRCSAAQTGGVRLRGGCARRR